MYRMHLLFAYALLFSGMGATQQEKTTQPAEDPQEVVESLYRLVTFGPDSPPDWEKVRGLFMDDAIIILRTSREEITKFTVDGFIREFIRFSENEKVVKNGFSEKIIRFRKTEFGHIAHFLVLYEASIPGTDSRPQQGVDSFQLVRKDSTWKIVSITNEVPGPDHPLPEELAD